MPDYLTLRDEAERAHRRGDSYLYVAPARLLALLDALAAHTDDRNRERCEVAMHLREIIVGMDSADVPASLVGELWDLALMLEARAGVGGQGEG